MRSLNLTGKTFGSKIYCQISLFFLLSLLIFFLSRPFSFLLFLLLFLRPFSCQVFLHSLTLPTLSYAFTLWFSRYSGWLCFAFLQRIIVIGLQTAVVSKLIFHENPEVKKYLISKNWIGFSSYICFYWAKENNSNKIKQNFLSCFFSIRNYLVDLQNVKVAFYYIFSSFSFFCQFSCLFVSIDSVIDAEEEKEFLFFFFLLTY